MTMASLTRYEITQPIPMVVLPCVECANYFAMTEAFDELRHDDGETFFCPAGHRQTYVSKEPPEKEDKPKFSATEYADNALLRAQVKFLAQKLQAAELALKTAKGRKQWPKTRKPGPSQQDGSIKP